MISDKSPLSISVGVVLDLEASVGRMSRPIISLALEDFYASHVDYRTRLQLHFRDSKEDIVVAASEGNREEMDKMVLAQKIHPVSRGISFSLQPTGGADLLSFVIFSWIFFCYRLFPAKPSGSKICKLLCFS